MKSEYAVFSIPVGPVTGDVSELNLFIRQNRVVQVTKELVRIADGSYWTFLVEYLPGGERNAEHGGATAKHGIDYRELLSDEDFAIFVKLKELRISLAEKDGLPVYAVFNNQQLYQIAERKPATLAALREIKGVGEAKAKSYGPAVLEFLKATAAAVTASGPEQPSPDKQDEARR